jgi:hypothetical protein
MTEYTKVRETKFQNCFNNVYVKYKHTNELAVCSIFGVCVRRESQLHLQAPPLVSPCRVVPRLQLHSENGLTSRFFLHISLKLEQRGTPPLHLQENNATSLAYLRSCVRSGPRSRCHWTQFVCGPRSRCHYWT